MSTVVKDLGAVSAYAYAVEKGYTGTEAEFAELMASYATVGQTAVNAAQTATTKASEAATSATTATNKATEATTAATTATNKAGEASTSASTATSAKDTAVSAASTATTKATEATTAAATATSAATTATTAKDDAVSAKTAAQTAQTGAETAAASVQSSAAQIATNAEDISQLKSEIADKSDTVDMLKAFPTDTALGSVASFADGANVPVKSLIVNIDPVQSGSGDPSPTNIRPISGWSEVNVQRTGKNLLAKPFMHNSTVPSSIGECFFVKAGTYTFSFETTTATSWRFGFRMLDANGNELSDDAYKPQAGYFWNTSTHSWLNGANITAKSVVISVVKDCYLRIIFSIGDTTASTIFTGAQLELGETATAYEPYSGQSITISLGQTVYGGTLDVTKGELVIDRAMVDLGTLTWSKASTTSGKWRFQTTKSDIKIATSDGVIPNMICEIYKTISPDNTYVGVTGISNNINIHNIFICDLSISDVTTLVNAINGKKVVYPLATPLTISLTPHEVTALLGSNNIWADTGDSTVEYRADPTLYIQRLTEPDADMVADANITSGSYFMVGNTLYKATANIASGATISPNVNCTRKSLSEALNELNA